MIRIATLRIVDYVVLGISGMAAFGGKKKPFNTAPERQSRVESSFTPKAASVPYIFCFLISPPMLVAKYEMPYIFAAIYLLAVYSLRKDKP